MAMESSSSELDVDESILKRVKNAFTRVATAQRDSDFMVDEDLGFILEKEGASSEGVTEMLQKRQDELQRQKESLEAEIREMEEHIAAKQLQSDTQLDAELESGILSLAGGSGDASQTESEVLSRLVESAAGELGTKELDRLKSHIKLSESFNGIKFKSVNWEVKHTDDAGLLREHTHIGSVLDDYEFKVVFVTREDKGDSSEGEEVARILELTLEVDSRAERDMEAFLAMVSMDRDLMAFYQTYLKYCLYHRERAEAFKVAKTNFDESVHFTQGSTGYRLRFSNDRGVKLVFTWDLIVSVQGVVEHSIDVQVKTPSNASDSVVEILSRVPQLLDNMVFAYGHKEGFLQLLTLFKPPDGEL